jgi:hypothetical protein
VLPIGQLVAIAEIMRGGRLDGSLVAIGGGAFGFGPGLGPPVRRALPAFQGAIEAALIDAIHVAALFNMIVRLADSLGWDVPSFEEFHARADRMLATGYALD